MARKTSIPAKKIVIALVIGVVASVIGALIYYNVFPSRVYRVQITPLAEANLLKIGAQTLRQSPNQDGLLFLHVTITSEEENTPPTVEVQPKEETKWYTQQVQQAGKKTYMAQIQLGSKEWPIRGGEEYLLRASAGKGRATARISVERAPTGTE